ncbi:hypothetical protein G6011_09854 [Alternaria panax]|uniref:Heterokaryon incompatibility domain-containing protein n=1 Tax=Alternaria panax TaxID=48097 RepID=A0AAD4I7L5_9PLEO|nr:hypothetical protein G6011_09854 [Alternaria panax]
MTETASKWLALDVKYLHEKELLPGVIAKHGVRPYLPTQMVKIPFDNANEVAVVSWRWDGDTHFQGSRNIASVIHCAKQRGIRYLFIDIISIDQTLPTSDLIEQIAAFSALYTKITVLAAYDTEGPGSIAPLKFTVLRPWILNEMRLFRQNPGRIVYVGYRNQGTKARGFDASQSIIAGWNEKNKRPYFVTLLERIWQSSFIDSVIGVLLGDVGMSFVSDFKYIIHAYSHICSVAYERMEEDDYLLTIAILCRIHSDVGMPTGLDTFSRGLQNIYYSRYSFTKLPEKSGGTWTYYEISLDGTPVALWNDNHYHYEDNDFYELIALGDSERVIFAALGLTELEYENFVATEEARRACLLLDNGMEIPVPDVEVVEVDLSSF